MPVSSVVCATKKSAKGSSWGFISPYLGVRSIRGLQLAERSPKSRLLSTFRAIPARRDRYDGPTAYRLSLPAGRLPGAPRFALRGGGAKGTNTEPERKCMDSPRGPFFRVLPGRALGLGGSGLVWALASPAPCGRGRGWRKLKR
jgi:hypothetical protein